MPKLKSHSGAKKRFKKTASGKIKYKMAGARHLLTGMSTKRSRKLAKKKILQKTDARTINRLLPY
ncbi:MAG: 50S ribosomal protein L35 [bacterium]